MTAALLSAHASTTKYLGLERFVVPFLDEDPELKVINARKLAELKKRAERAS